MSSTAYFTKYTDSDFDDQDQEELVDVFRKLNDRNVRILLSNSSISFVKEVYSDFADYINEVNAIRSINCKGSRRGGH